MTQTRAMNCPRCKTALAPPSNPDGIVTCPGCGSRLIARSGAQRPQAEKPAAAPVPPQPLPPSRVAPPPPAQPPARQAQATGELGLRLEQLIAEVRALSASQHHALELLEGIRQTLGTRPASLPAEASGTISDFVDDDDAPPLTPIRVRRHKTVLLLDDDTQTREAAVAELQRCDVPVRAFDDGRAAISAIAEEKPDVIAVELAVGGEMGGKDLVNLVKATMEWVHIPIVLWTREPIASQREARQIHGADELVLKSAGAVALAARVINVFRR